MNSPTTLDEILAAMWADLPRATFLDEILAAMWAELPRVSDTERPELLAAIGRLEAQR